MNDHRIVWDRAGRTTLCAIDLELGWCVGFVYWDEDLEHDGRLCGWSWAFFTDPLGHDILKAPPIRPGTTLAEQAAAERVACNAATPKILEMLVAWEAIEAEVRSQDS
ncbi:MAG: hypothetical protein NTX16_10620 [Actinobacteria bacterium]|nr:hypothetical protein [Actinomycetota bacterium]